MASLSIPRFLLPRANLYLRDQRLQHRLATLGLRHASTSAPSKPRVLEKPERFNPPSHPARLRKTPRQYPGAPLAEHEREAQKTRQYPHMMPPEGSFMHWFLTNKMIHTWITLSVLVSLAFFTVITNFLHTTVYRDQLPDNSIFLSHPIQFIRRYLQVYNMHTAHISAETAERRKQKVEDVRKRSEYRKAHGLENEGLFGGWTAKTEEESMGPALREGGGPPPSMAVVQDASPVAGASVYADFDGNTKPARKWFGIW